MIRNDKERATLTARAEIIARLLPGKFRVNHLTKNQHTVEIMDDKRRYFTIDPDVYGNGRKLRIRCGARWSSYAINCAPTRSDDAIAGDIERRLLPDFYTAWKQHNDRVALEKSRAAALELHKQTLNRVAPVRSGHHNNWWIHGADIRPPHDPSPDSTHSNYELRASVSFDKLIRIAAIINEDKPT